MKPRQLSLLLSLDEYNFLCAALHEKRQNERRLAALMQNEHNKSYHLKQNDTGLLATDNLCAAWAAAGPQSPPRKRR